MKKLYNELVKQGKYTKSFEEFKSQFGSEDGQEKLHGALSESGDYTKSLSDFSSQFFSENEVKIEDGAVGEVSGNQEAVAGETAGVTAINQEAVLQEDLKYSDQFFTPRSTTLNKQEGELMFGDQRNLDQQINDYEQQLNDAINATGNFEYLKDKTKKERLKLSQKLVAKPAYSESVYNEYKDSYEIKPTKDLAEVLSSYLPDDYDLYTTPKEFQNALEQGVNQALVNDPVLKIERRAFEAIASEDINKQMQVISGKYDLTVPEEVDKANAELNDYIRDEIVIPFENSKTFETVKDQYKDMTTAVMAERNKEFGRSKDSFLKDDPYAFIEGVQKGLIQMNVGLRQADISTLHSSIADIDKNLAFLQTGLDDGSLTEDTEVKLRRFSKTGDRPIGSPQQKIDELNKQRDSAIKRIVSGVGTISEKEQRLSLFKSADFNDGITLEEAMLSIGEATPQIVAAGLSGLVSGGIGLSLIFAQEYGSNYYTALTEGLVADGVEPTDENIANAIAGGLYADRAEAAAFAVLQASLERVGATGVMKNFTKSVGLGTNFKKATSSLFRGEVKQFIKNAPKKIKSMAVSGTGEALTEGGQAILSQVSIGAQLDTDLRTFLDPEEVKQSMQQGGFIGVMMPFAGKVAGQGAIEARQAARTVSTKFDLKNAENLKLVDSFFKASEANIKAKLDANEISQEEYNTELQDLSNARNTGLKIPSNYSIENKEKAFDLILKRDKLQREVEELDSALSENQKDEIKEINEELRSISDVELVKSRLEKSISFAEKEAGSYGLKVDVIGKASDVVAKYGEEAGTADGGVIDGVIFINKEVARNTRAVNVGSHELLHGILKNALIEGKAPGLVADFRSMLTAEQNAAIDKRVLAVDKDGNRLYSEEYLKENPDEYLTMFSDAIQDKEISFNEGIMTKIGDLIKPILRAAGFKQIKFETGEDVYDFLREYSKSVEKGKLSKGIKKATEGEVDMKGSKFSLSATDSAKVNELYETQGDAALMDVVDLMEPTARGLADSYRNRPKFSEFKDQLTDEILNGKRGMMETVMGYPAYVKKQEAERQSLISQGKRKEADKIKTAPLSGYINNSFSTKTGFKRYIDIADRILGKDEQSQFTQEINNESLNVENDEDIDISDFSSEISQSTINALKAAGLSTVESVLDQDIASIVKQTKLDARVIKDAVDVFREELDVRSGRKQLDTKERESLRKKIELTPEVTQKVRDAVAKTFGTKLPDINSPKFKTALQKAFRTELKTTMAKDVMGSRAAFETFLRDNFETIFEVIPQGVMNKRFKAFIEPVLDSNGKQKREKTAQGNPVFKKKPVVKAEFIKYFLGSEVGGSTKGTRKDALAEALAEEFAFDATMETIQTKDVATKREFLDKGQTTDKVSKKIDRPSTMKFSKKRRDAELIKGEKRVLKNTNAKDVEFFQETITDILPQFLPVDSFINSNNFASRSDKYGRGHFMTGKERAEILKKAMLNQADFSLEQINQVKVAIGSKAFFNKVKGKKVSIDYGSDIYKQRIKDNYDGLEIILQGMADMVEAYPETISVVSAIFDSASGNSGHFIRQAAIPRGQDQGFIDAGFIGEKEHIWQQNEAGLDMFNAIRNNNVSDLMPYIKENYFMIGLSAEANSKLKDISGKYGKPFNFGEKLPENIAQSIKNGIKEGDLSDALSVWGRYFNEEVNAINGGIDPNTTYFDGKPVSENLDAALPAKDKTPDALENQRNEIAKQLKDPSYKAKEAIKVFQALVPGKSGASELNNNTMPVIIKYSKGITVQQGVDALAKTDKALELARKLDQPVRKIRVFDFDDTLARTKSNVLYTMPDGTTGKIDAATFAKEASNMEAEGAQWDFSEFSKVMQGSKGPLLDVAKIIADKRGTKDVFVLTARPANAAGPIKEFLASMGLDIPLANITGLGDGAPAAKAGWIMGKAAEGYNDFYFADDHTGNVKAVKDVLSQIDVKSKVQLAKFSKSATFDTIVNDMIEDSSGIETYKKYSAAKAKTVGASKGKYNFFIAPSAEDFTGLLYKMLGKGKKGDAQMAFLKANLLDPYNRAESAVTQAKIAAANDFKALKNELKTLPKTLSKQTGIGNFTYSHAVRVAAWTRQGMEVPGLSKRDIKELVEFVDNDAKLNTFTNELIVIQKGKQYPKPSKDWLGGNITTDIIGDINKVNRAEYQQEWRENLGIIFSEDNMNKMEAAYGTRWREAIEDSIRRMKSGSNKPIGGNKVTEGLLTWLNNSVGAVMFLNTRSALLQTISAVNFINLSDNNIVKAGIAFANQKQFWGDFMTLMNSDYLVERRNGLKINVSESEIADAVREAQNKPKAAIAFLLSKGFVMTRFADSFAIASGGSTFYRNRLKSLLKGGMDQKAAEAQAFADFKAIAEESQQSSSPSKISQQQASAAGRVILAWANTPMQYARIQKRAGQDLINGRGDWKTNVSKIVYYGAVQNLIFNTLQQAVFALGFGDDDEEDEVKAEKRENKAYKVANGMIDSQLKGLGIFGAASVAMKNTLMTLYEQHGEKSPKYENAVDDLLSFSPPLGSKISKIKGGFRSFSWNKKEMQTKGFSLDNPAYLAGAQIVTGFTNVPLDRLAKKINNMRGIYSEKSARWQKVALGLGWSTWDVDLGYYGGFDEETKEVKKRVSEMTVEEKKKYRKQKESERAKIRKQIEFERERRRIERNK